MRQFFCAVLTVTINMIHVIENEAPQNGDIHGTKIFVVSRNNFTPCLSVSSLVAVISKNPKNPRIVKPFQNH
jgi:hypothetical protein